MSIYTDNYFITLEKFLSDDPDHDFILALDTQQSWRSKDTVVELIQNEKTTSTCPKCSAPLNGNNICKYCKTRTTLIYK